MVVRTVRVRRFFCAAVGRVRMIFAEQVDGLTVRHGRSSLLARRLLESVALALGGRAADRPSRAGRCRPRSRWPGSVRPGGAPSC